MKKLFEDTLIDWIVANGMFEAVDSVLLAVSGGADSVAMAHVLAKLKQQGRLSCDFMIGHVNHNLRGGESDADQVFVQELGDSLGIKVCSESVDVAGYAKANKLSIETAGRYLRLKTLAGMAERNNCDAIATAHHKDDLAETMIHRLMRGTGFRGLSGIKPLSTVDGALYIRPMLAVRRTEIIRYCYENNIQWRQDASNANMTFTRNRIRHRLLPALESEFVSIVDKLEILSTASRKFQWFAEKHAKAIVDKGMLDLPAGRFSIQQEFLKEPAPWVFYEVVRNVLVELGVGLRDYSQQHFDAISEMVKQEKTKADFPGQIEVSVENGLVLVQVKKSSAISFPKPITLQIGQTVEFGQWKISSRQFNRSEVDLGKFSKTKDSLVEWFDADKIAGDIEIRCRKDGDRFHPIGAKSAKKVGRFLIDAQLDEKLKKQAFVVADDEKILWLAPVRMSEQTKITPKTRHIVEIRLIELK